MDSSVATNTGGGFQHEAFIYHNDDDYFAGNVAFIRDALDEGEPILVAVSASRIEHFRSLLGERADAVEFAVMEEIGQNPGYIISVWNEFLLRHVGRAGRVRGIGEPIWPGRSRDEVVECQHHEQLLNLAFEHAPSFLLRCPYDAGRLELSVLAEAERSHRRLTDGRETRSSSTFRDVDGRRILGSLLSPRPLHAETRHFRMSDLARVRQDVRDHADAAGLPLRRREDLAFAVSEVAGNSVRYAGSGELAQWIDGDQFVCEVRDAGQITDPLVGRKQPLPASPDGRGLWLTHQLCDLVQLRSSDAGTVVRLSMHRASDTY